MEQKKQTTESQRTRNILLALAGIMALQMISFGVIMPIFARRLGDFGDGVEALGLMAMAYSITSMTAAPIMGSLADRVGRRPLVLGSLAAYTAAFTGYLLAPSTQVFIIIRALAGALTAGLGPAVMGVVADIAPDEKRAQWIGVIGGGSSVGWVVGPTLGGLLYDQWGYVAPFGVSVVMAALALIVAIIIVPETLMREGRERAKSQTRGAASLRGGQLRPFLHTLPQPLSTFALLLLVSFTTIFAYAFIEPQLMFYVYDDLGWSSARFGMAISGLGLTLVLGQTLLGKLSDQFGRKPILIIGILLSGAMYATVSSTTSFQLIFLAYIVAGLGEALMGPALNAFYLDIANKEHKSRVMGIAGTAGALGGVAGPALVVLITRYVPPQSVFSIAVGLLVVVALLALFVLREPRQAEHDNPELTQYQSTTQILASEHS
jgi:DHA1 family tetracycline resistance protein-like MFS transporter